MAQSGFTKDQFWSECDDKGEDEVRLNLKLQRYNSDKKALAEEWLRKKDQARSDRSSSDSLRVARSAKNAAWVAAIAAIIAAICAIIPLLLK